MHFPELLSQIHITAGVKSFDPNSSHPNILLFCVIYSGVSRLEAAVTALGSPTRPAENRRLQRLPARAGPHLPRKRVAAIWPPPSEWLRPLSKHKFLQLANGNTTAIYFKWQFTQHKEDMYVFPVLCHANRSLQALPSGAFNQFLQNTAPVKTEGTKVI